MRAALRCCAALARSVAAAATTTAPSAGWLSAAVACRRQREARQQTLGRNGFKELRAVQSEVRLRCAHQHRHCGVAPHSLANVAKKGADVEATANLKLCRAAVRESGTHTPRALARSWRTDSEVWGAKVHTDCAVDLPQGGSTQVCQRVARASSGQHLDGPCGEVHYMTASRQLVRTHAVHVHRGKAAAAAVDKTTGARRRDW